MSNKLTYKKVYVNSNSDCLNQGHHLTLSLNYKKIWRCPKVVKCGLQKYRCLLHLKQPRSDFMNICM